MLTGRTSGVGVAVSVGVIVGRGVNDGCAVSRGCWSVVWLGVVVVAGFAGICDVQANKEIATNNSASKSKYLFMRPPEPNYWDITVIMIIIFAAVVDITKSIGLIIKAEQFSDGRNRGFESQQVTKRPFELAVNDIMR